MNLEMALEQAREIARYGSIIEKESFVEWACNSLAYLSLQQDKNGLITVQAQYLAYLEELERINKEV